MYFCHNPQHICKYLRINHNNKAKNKICDVKCINNFIKINYILLVNHQIQYEKHLVSDFSF